MRYLHDIPSRLRFWSPPVLIASFGGIGLIRPASGTWGSFAACLVAIIPLAYGQPLILIPMAAIAYAIGYWATQKWLAAIDDADNKDPSAIVIDEVAAQWLVLATVPPYSAFNLIVGFFYFRLFDVYKPWPVDFIDQHMKGAHAVMLDDVFAAAWAICAIFMLRALDVLV